MDQPKRVLPEQRPVAPPEAHPTYETPAVPTTQPAGFEAVGTVPVESPLKPTPESQPTMVETKKPPLVQAVEKVLSHGLEGVYQTLDPTVRPRFQSEGEKLAHHLATTLERSHFPETEFPHMVDGVSQWLAIIPGGIRSWRETESLSRARKVLLLAPNKTS